VIGLDRKRRGKDPHLEWKVRLFFVGGALALLGIALNSSAVVGGALVVLLAGMGLRFLPGNKEDR